MLRSDLTSTQRHILLTLSIHMDERGGGAHPSLSTIARETGLGRSTVSRDLGILETLGWIGIDRDPNAAQRQLANVYRASIPGELVHGVDQPLVHEVDQGSPGDGLGWSMGWKELVHEVDPNSRGNSTGTGGEEERLLERYGAADRETIHEAFAAFASTRSTGRMAGSVRLKQLQTWERYPVNQVIAGLQTYLAKGCAADGRGEAYALGIIRNTQPDALGNGAGRHLAPRYVRL